MNALARTLGMKRTRFLNPSGLDNMQGAQPFSTAADLGRLVRYAYSKSGFPFYVQQQTREVHFFRAGQPASVWLKNTNPLLDQDGIDGVKTGRTAKAGDCIILSADRAPEVQRNGEQVAVTPRRIVVVLLARRIARARASAICAAAGSFTTHGPRKAARRRRKTRSRTQRSKNLWPRNVSEC